MKHSGQGKFLCRVDSNNDYNSINNKNSKIVIVLITIIYKNKSTTNNNKIIILTNIKDYVFRSISDELKTLSESTEG